MPNSFPSVRNLPASVALVMTSAFAFAFAFNVNAASSLTVPSIVLNELACTVIPSTSPQGAPGQQGSVLTSGFSVHGRLTATPIANLYGYAARRYEYQYIVQNVSLPTGTLAYASNGSITSYTGKVQVDAYHAPWSPANYTPFAVVKDPLSSMQLDEPFYAQKIIGGGIVDATYIGPAFSIVVKGALKNGEMKNIAICTLLPSSTQPMIF